MRMMLDSTITRVIYPFTCKTVTLLFGTLLKPNGQTKVSELDVALARVV